MKQRVIVWLGIVSAIITIMIAVIPWFSEKAELDAYVEGGDYRLSPSDRANQKESDDIRSVFESKYIFKITITNNGEIEAKDVVLIIPYSSEHIEGLVVRKNTENQKLQSPAKAVLGSIKPTETIVVYLWSIHEISENKSLYNSSLKRVTISHSTGTVEANKPIDGKGNLGFVVGNIIDYALVFYFALVLLVFYVPVTMYNLGLKHNKTKSDDIDISESEKKLNLLSKAWSDGAIAEAEYQKRYIEVLDKALKQPKPNK